MEQNNVPGLTITGQGEDVGGKFYTVTLLDLGNLTAGDRVYNGDITHLTRSIRRLPRVYCEVDPYHDHRFQIPESQDRFVRAVTSIDVQNVCAAIDNIRIDKVKGKVTGELRPWGPHARMVQGLLEDRNANVTFGMRALKTTSGAIDQIICWDLLPE